MNIKTFAGFLLQSCRSAAATALALASLTVPAWATLTSVSPTSTAINVATGGTYSFTVTGSPGETVSTQSRFCFDVGVPVPANGIIFPSAGGCTSSSVIPSNPVVAAGSVYSFSGFVTPLQAGIMAAEAAAVGQPAGNRFVYWRQGFGTSGFAIVRVNLIEPVVVANPPTLSPTSLNFGNVNVGSSSAGQVMTLTNPGPGPINITGAVASSGFAFSSNCTGILITSCQFTVVFAPTAAQTFNGQLTISTTGGTVSGNLSGTGVPVTTAPPSLTPASINFGNVQVGQTSAPQTLTFASNTAATNPTLDIFHPPFVTLTTTCPTSLTANLTCRITAICAPASPGPQSGSITVVAGSLNASSSVACTGVAALQPTLLPSSASFGSVVVGTTSAPQVFTLSNPTSTAIAGVNVSVANGFIQTSTCGAGVAANSSCQISVSFAPTLAQPFSGLLTVVAGASSLSSGLSGTGTASPSAAPFLAPTSANFGSVPVGAAPVTQSFTLSNSGNAPLSVLVINVPPGFTQLSNCGTALAAGTSCQINVSFAPTNAQAYSGLLTVVAGPSTFSSALSGVGAAGPIVSVASTLTDVSPKRLVGNVSSDLTQVLSYTFSGNTTNVSPGEGIFCFDLVPGLSPGNTTSGNPCTSGSQFARHPTVASAFQSTRVGAVIRSVRETIRVPSAVSRFARESGRSRYFFARQFSPNQYAVITIELLGNVANQPIAITDMRMYFKQGGEQPIVFLKRGDALPTIEARLLFTGSGFLRGAWEVVQPGDVEPTDIDLTPDASLPREQRGLQRRYSVVGTFQQYLPAVGQVTLTPPDLSRFPVTVDGGYRVLLRLFADPAIGGAESDGRLSSGGAAFALPTARYFVGGFASHGTTSKLASISVSLPSVNHAFSAAESVNFRWQAVRDAAIYLLEAAGESGNVVAAAQVPASDVELNAGYSAPTPWRAQAALGTGAVRWRVTAYGRDGEPLARSDWRTVRF